MDDLRLVREVSDQDGTFGRLFLPDGRWWFTMEDDWRNNLVGQSCIPLGRYRLQRTIYHKKALAVPPDPYWLALKFQTFEVRDVPDRTRILLHPATTEEDVEGCIGVGCVQGYVIVPRDEDTNAPAVRKRAVLQSRKAFTALMGALRGADDAWLRVTGVVG
jgi:hypothetical protein